MRAHRVIWAITGIVALAAGAVFAARQIWHTPPAPKAPVGRALSGREADRLVEAMLACLDRDPQARRDKTRLLVRAVAAMAESGATRSPETYYALGLAKSSTTPPSRGAEEAYREAIALKPDWSLAHNSLGILLHTLGRLDEAEAELRKAIALAPGWGRPHNDLAILLRLTARYAEAEQQALEALRLEPDGVATNNNYGNLLVELRRFDEAQRAYEKAIAGEPDHPAPYYNLACLASLRGDRDDALSYLNCAVVLDDSFRAEARRDPDFAAVRDEPEFRALVGAEAAL